MRNFSLIILTCLTLIFCSSVKAEVWFGSYANSVASIGRIQTNGTAMSSIAVGEGQYVEDITMVNNEVWVSYWQGNKIDRFSIAGAHLGNVNVGPMNAGLLSVGNEVWFGSYTNSTASIGRISLDGTPLSSIAINDGYVEDLIMVDNEIWVSYWQGNIIDRFSTTGVHLGNLDVGNMNAGLLSIPEPTTIILLTLGGVLLRKRINHAR